MLARCPCSYWRSYFPKLEQFNWNSLIISGRPNKPQLGCAINFYGVITGKQFTSPPESHDSSFDVSDSFYLVCSIVNRHADDSKCTSTFQLLAKTRRWMEVKVLRQEALPTRRLPSKNGTFHFKEFHQPSNIPRDVARGDGNWKVWGMWNFVSFKRIKKADVSFMVHLKSLSFSPCLHQKALQKKNSEKFPFRMIQQKKTKLPPQTGSTSTIPP